MQITHTTGPDKTKWKSITWAMTGSQTLEAHSPHPPSSRPPHFPPFDILEGKEYQMSRHMMTDFDAILVGKFFILRPFPSFLHLLPLLHSRYFVFKKKYIFHFFSIYICLRSFDIHVARQWRANVTLTVGRGWRDSRQVAKVVDTFSLFLETNGWFLFLIKKKKRGNTKKRK